MEEMEAGLRRQDLTLMGGKKTKRQGAEEAVKGKLNATSGSKKFSWAEKGKWVDIPESNKDATQRKCPMRLWRPKNSWKLNSISS